MTLSPDLRRQAGIYQRASAYLYEDASQYLNEDTIQTRIKQQARAAKFSKIARENLFQLLCAEPE